MEDTQSQYVSLQSSSRKQSFLELSERILSVSLNDPFSAIKLEKLSGDEAREEKGENSCELLKSWLLSMV